MKEFDTSKGAFLLVALVIGTQMLVILSVIGTCGIMIIMDPNLNPGVCKDVSDPISQLFQMSFTAAIAFAGGRMSAPTYDPPKLPPKKPPPPKVPPPPNVAKETTNPNQGVP